MEYVLRSDLAFEREKLQVDGNEKIFIKDIKKNKDEFCSVIKFSRTSDYEELTNALEKKIKTFLKKENIKKESHVFVVGIGNDSHTADAIGPKVLKYLKVNAYLEELGLNMDGIKVSSLEPGVLGETGIDTERIVESVVDEIRPDVVIVIDSLVAENLENLNSVIEITNMGVIPGSGIKINSDEISKKTLGIPVITIGVATAVEINVDDNTYFLSTSDIDLFVDKISRVIGESLNRIFYA